MSDELVRRVEHLEEDYEDMKILLYGDPSKAEPGGLRALVNESLTVARRTETQRNVDRQRENTFQAQVNTKLDWLTKKNVVSDTTVKSRWTLLKEIGVILMLAGAGVKLLTDSAPKIAHMLGF